MMNGNIIDVKRFTVHDGYGIRTTVFLKGCSLRCAWCQNPEGMENRIGLWYLPRPCIRCRICLDACPEGALSACEEDEAFIHIDRDRCTLCGHCVKACPTTALSFDGQRLSSQAVVDLLLRDREFYDQSGGGITISGGDPLVQHAFASEILAACKEAGIHTAMETCLHGSREILASFLPLTDLFIVDLKLYDDEVHRQYTGQGNGLIKENYRYLVKGAADLLTRIPLIPGITATPENIRGLARFIQGSNPGGRVELINFNPLAENKYRLMGKSREFFQGMVPLDTTELTALHAILEAEGLKAIGEHRSGDVHA